ncbi:hypothetical protein STCU_04519 [Strigomonas culicis]|nr:hypothetical protein STCU_04519 [Strigomonas culicis]|eukprot:EPY29502.1 hypothetical protein STCU_04519 [Strigomonas culicis]
MQDANGLREALRLVELCRVSVSAPPSDGSNPHSPSSQKQLIRPLVIKECMERASDLSMNANGSELMLHVVPLLSNGAVSAASQRQATDASAAPAEYSEYMQLIEILGKDLVIMCCNTNGARVAQKIADSLKHLEEFHCFSKAVSSSVVTLATDINGNHTLSKFMLCERSKRLSVQGSNEYERQQLEQIEKQIYDVLSKECISVCRNRQGCCIIQKCLQWAPEPYHSQILNTVLSSVLKLVQDPFGNYVIQFILERQDDIACPGNAEKPNYTNEIIRYMLHHVAELSCNKFSSNVIEKCLKAAHSDVKQLMVDELTEPQVLPKLLTDSYANYVIQTAIATASDEAQYNQLRDAIMPLQSLLKNSPYGVKIENKLARRHRDPSIRHPKKRNAPNATKFSVEGDILNPQFMPNLTTLQMVSRDGSMGQTVALTNINSNDVSSFLNPQHMMNSVPFVLQGQQMLGMHNAPQPQPFAVNVMHNSDTLQPEYN